MSQGLTHHRIIWKDGACNIYQPDTRRQKLGLLRYERLVDASWPHTLFVFLMTLLTSWFLFAVVYWIICHAHGDFETNHLPDSQEYYNHTPCIYKMENFYSCFIFSIEAQHTVGYGIKAPTEECAEAIFVNIIQCIMGFIMQGFMAVIIFSKVTIPRLRSHTLLFSKNAAILSKNGSKSFMFRIGDIRKDHLSEPKCRAFYIFTDKTTEGEMLQNQQIELPMKADGCHKTLFFNWPLVMIHEINEDSPLNNILNNKDNFEVLVILEGNVDATGQTVQGRTSYAFDDILWEHEFENIININVYTNEYVVDFSKFDNVRPIT